MKLCFSTLACPRWTFDEIVSTAKDFGYDSVEIRGVADKIFAPEIKAFLPENVAETKARLSRLGITIQCLTSAATIAEEANYDQSMAEAKAYIDLAEKLGVPFVRIMGTGKPDFSEGNAELAAKGYAELVEYAYEKNVTPLLETNGIFCDTSLLKKIMESVPLPNKGVLWDVHHPYRFGNEDVKTTVSNVGKYIRHVHLKDSVKSSDGIAYKIMGYGDIPLEVMISELQKIGYDGAFCLEWVKRWNTQLEEPGIVLMNYVGYMNSLQ